VKINIDDLEGADLSQIRADIAALQAAGGGGSGSDGGSLDPKSAVFGATGDGTTDDYAAIAACFAAAKLAGYGVSFRPGSYRISKAIIIDGFDKLKINAIGNVTIKFPSSDTGLTNGTAGYDGVASHARSGFYIKNSNDVHIEGLKFLGDSVETDVDVNGGCAVSLGASAIRGKMLLCEQFYGGGLIDGRVASAADWLVKDCYSYGSRKNSRLGNNGRFVHCTFELPTTSSYDRVGNAGSSHAIYIFALAGNRVSVENCTFISIRWPGFTVSGSGNALRSYSVSGCLFYLCGINSDGTDTGKSAVYLGDDSGSQIHAQMDVSRNRFLDCRGAIMIWGARQVCVSENKVYNTGSFSGGAAGSAINIALYGATLPPDGVLVLGNQFDSEIAVGSQNFEVAINIAEVGEGLADRVSNIQVKHNQVLNGYGGIVQVEGCIAPIIEDNVGVGIASNGEVIDVTGCRMPRVLRNDIIDQRANLASIRMDNASWPIISRNWGAGRIIAAFRGKPGIGDNAQDVNPAINFPLLGLSGRVAPTGLRPEVVFAYGYDWTTNDTVVINGSATFTYKATSPGSNEFNTVAGLIALIDGLASYTANDYGDPWGIVTNHIRVRNASTSGTANLFYVITSCAKKTAGVIIVNSAAGTGDRCYSRGEGSSGDRLVIWSPCIEQGHVPQLIPENANAQTSLANVPLPVVTDADDEAYADCVLELPTLTSGELYTWRF
jgi:hypothetical protein